MGKNKAQIQTNLSHLSFTYGLTEGKEKIVIINHKDHSHYTILFDSLRKIVDIHRKNDVTKVYDDIIAHIPYEVCEHFFQFCETEASELALKYLRPKEVTIGKLIRSRYLLLPQAPPKQEDQFITRKGKRLRLLREIPETAVAALFMRPWQLLNCPTGDYYVFTGRNKKNSIVGTLSKTENGKFYLQPQADLLTFCRIMSIHARTFVSQLQHPEVDKLHRFLQSFSLK